MVCAIVIANLLLVSAVFSAPSLETTRFKHRAAGRQPDTRHATQYLEAPVDHVRRANTPTANLAGASYRDLKGVAVVSAVITLPNVTGSGIASAWVGIDGDSCPTALLQAGIDFVVDPFGHGLFVAWSAWYPYATIDFTNITFKANDRVRLTVTASSLNSGSAFIENLSSATPVHREFINSPSPLCQKDAGWFIGGGDSIPNFGTVTFAEAYAITPTNSTITPAMANMVDIQRNNQTFTTTFVDASSVNVQYTAPSDSKAGHVS